MGSIPDAEDPLEEDKETHSSIQVLSRIGMGPIWCGVGGPGYKIISSSPEYTVP